LFNNVQILLLVLKLAWGCRQKLTDSTKEKKKFIFLSVAIICRARFCVHVMQNNSVH